MTTHKKSDQELIDLMKGGDELAFAELVDRYSQKVHNLAIRLTRSEEDTEEVLQDVFVTIYRKIASFEAKSAFSSWLYRITVNTAFMKLRRYRRQNLISFDEYEMHLEDKIHSNGNGTSQLTSLGSQDELRQTIQRAVNKLPYEYKLIFILRDVDGLSNQAVSEIMQLSVAAIKSRLHRSRLILRKRLRSFYEDISSPTKIFYGKAIQA